MFFFKFYESAFEFLKDLLFSGCRAVSRRQSRRTHAVDHSENYKIRSGGKWGKIRDKNVKNKTLLFYRRYTIFSTFNAFNNHVFFVNRKYSDYNIYFRWFFVDAFDFVPTWYCTEYDADEFVDESRRGCDVEALPRMAVRHESRRRFSPKSSRLRDSH